MLDVSDPGNLQLRSFFPTGGFSQKINVKDSLAFVASGLTGLWILDVSNPEKPIAISNINTGSFTSDLVVEDTLAYIINWPAYSAYVGGDTSRGLWIIDISNIYEPEILTHYIGISNDTYHAVASSIAKSGNLILITQAPTATSIDIMELIDVSNVFQPSRVGVFQSNTDPYDITVKDTIVYLATDAGLKIINISDPVNPNEISSILTSARGVTFHNPYIYTSTYIFSIINVDDPANPFIISSINTQSSSQGRRDLVAYGNYAYWAEFYLGIIDISNPENPLQITTFLGKDIGSGVAANANKIFFADLRMGIWILKNNLITTVGENKTDIVPNKVELYQNHPNPFNPNTTIKFEMPKEGLVTLKIYDILGAEVATLVNEVKTAGRYEVNFNTSTLASGVYLYCIQVNDFVNTKKMILMK